VEPGLKVQLKHWLFQEVLFTLSAFFILAFLY